MRTRGAILALLALLMLTPLIRLAWAGGGTTAGFIHRNCATTEPTIHADGHTLLCDDFELGVTGAAPGGWYGRGCDQVGTSGSGEASREGRGWCGQPADVAGVIGPFALCGGLGAIGSLCTARVIVTGSGDEAHAQHNFETTCRTGGLNCVVTGGIAHYDEIYVRFLIRMDVGWFAGQNQKLITINPCCNGTGGIILGGTGMIFGDTKLSMVGVEDNWHYDNDPFYRNPNANGQGDNCSGSSCEFVGDNLGSPLDTGGSRLGRWTAIELRYRLNTSNVQNGIYQVWKDDCGVSGTSCPATQTLRGSYTDIRYRGTNNVAGGGGSSNAALKIGGLFVDTWTGGGGDNNSIGTMKIDQLVVSTQQIGWPGNAASGTPAAPTNLRFGAWERRLMRALGIGA